MPPPDEGGIGIVNKAIRYGLVNAMTGITCAAIMATTWSEFMKGFLISLIVVCVSACSAMSIDIGEKP